MISSTHQRTRSNPADPFLDPGWGTDVVEHQKSSSRSEALVNPQRQAIDRCDMVETVPADDPVELTHRKLDRVQIGHSILDATGSPLSLPDPFRVFARGSGNSKISRIRVGPIQPDAPIPRVKEDRTPSGLLSHAERHVR